MDPVGASTAVKAVGVVAAAAADAAGVGVGASGRARVGALATQQEDKNMGRPWCAAVYGAARLRQL